MPAEAEETNGGEDEESRLNRKHPAKTREGVDLTGEGGTDVWPGAWSLERRRAIGLNLRLGYVPHSLEFLGPGRSLYLIAGTRWVDAEIEARHVN